MTYRVARLACNRWEGAVPHNNLKETIKHQEVVELEVLKVGQDRIKDNKVQVNKDKVPKDKVKVHREEVPCHKPLDLLDNCNLIFKEFSILM